MYVEIYVHPSTGDDSADGTRTHPYRSVARAVSEVCSVSNAVKDDDEYNINIMLGCGVNKVDSTIVLKNIASGIKLTFRPWDDMYTTLSCAERVDSFGFEYDENTGLYSYNAKSDVSGLYVNGRYANCAQNSECAMPGSVFVNRNMIFYRPMRNEDIKYSVTELAGNHTMFDICGCSGITFENIEFTGAGQNSTALINLEACSHIRLNGCRFRSSASKMVRCINGSKDIDICNCEFIGIDAQCMEFMESSDVMVSNNYFDSCSETCITFGKCDRAVISFSTFYRTALPVCIANGYELRFENCKIECYGTGDFILGIKRENTILDFNGNYILTDNSILKAVRGNSHSVYDDSPDLFTYKNVMVTKDSFGCESDLTEFVYQMINTGNSEEQKNNTDVDHIKESIISNAGYHKVVKNYGDII